MNYTDEQLIYLSRNCPKEVVKLLTTPGTDTKILIAGVEIFCGESTNETLVLSVIRFLINHTNALVREGSLIGITAQYIDFHNKYKKPPQDILDRLKIISTNDPSANLKIYAKDLLEKFID